MPPLCSSPARSFLTQPNVISCNTASTYGGGILSVSSLIEGEASVTIKGGSSIASNFAKYGGGIAAVGAMVSIEGSNTYTDIAADIGHDLLLKDAPYNNNGSTIIPVANIYQEWARPA